MVSPIDCGEVLSRYNIALVLRERQCLWLENLVSYS